MVFQKLNRINATTWNPGPAQDFLLLVDDFEVRPSPFIFKLDEHCSVIRLEPLTLSSRMSVHLETNINITRYIFADSKNMKILEDFVKYEDI